MESKEYFRDVEVYIFPLTLFRIVLTVFFNCLHTKSLLVTQFLKPDTQTPEAHTKSVKPYTNSWPSTQFSIS